MNGRMYEKGKSNRRGRLYEARRFKGRQGRGKKEYEKTGRVYIFEWMRIELEKETKHKCTVSDRLTRADKTKEAILFTCNPRPLEEK